jgi:glutamate/tyrosine decarboxylase-like PLP-dependent enzyme
MDQPEISHKAPPSSLNPSPDEIMEMGEAAIRIIADYFGSLTNVPVHSNSSSQAIREKLDEELPVEGKDFNKLLEVVEQVIFPTSRHHGHPRFFGYVASPGTAATAIADLLASSLNPNVTSWRSAPGPTEVERLTIRWIKEIIGYAPEADGLFVSGGSMANLCGLVAARNAKAPIDVTTVGFQALDKPMRVYVSEEAHHSISKAAGLLGIGHNNVRHVAVNQRFQMDTNALEKAIEEDLASSYLPFCVVASAGTVNTGAVDHLDEVADVASKYNLWFHVDGCYGGLAALAPSKRDLFRGIDRADSVALDQHKWLYVPNDCSCVLYRDPALARTTFEHDAEYIRVLDHVDDEAYAFWDYGPELTRRFRALKVWMELSHVGTRALGESIEHNCECARYLAQLVEQSSDFEMLAPVELSIFCFRYIPPALKAAYAQASAEEQKTIDHDLNGLNERILTGVQKGGNSYLSNANLAGRFALRGCVLNYRTTLHDMEILLDDVRQVAQALQASS